MSNAGFYDTWARRLVTDYLRGNPRAESAIAFAAAALPGGAPDVLDIGCGIGWSTWELERRCDPGARLLGLDLSPRLVETARALFADDAGARFDALDFVADALPAGPFDAIVLLDVYEHFPAQSRPQVNARLATLLRESGRLILSTPTVAHQTYLRTQRPEGLQPVDEDVTRDDLGELAATVAGRIVEFETVSIWRPGDYQHAVVERGTPRPPDPALVRLEERPERERRVRSRLGVRWSPSAGLLAVRGTTVVCVAVTAPGPLSEPLRTQAELLTGQVHVLRVPEGRTDADESLLPPIVSGGLRRLARVVRRSPTGAQDVVHRHLPAAGRTWFYRRYLRRIDADSVLAGSAEAAAELRSACTAEGIALVEAERT